MPVEIRELQIKVTVNDQQAKDAAAAPGNQATANEKKAMMLQCIDEIMDILNSKKER